MDTEKWIGSNTREYLVTSGAVCQFRLLDIGNKKALLNLLELLAMTGYIVVCLAL